jgi:D-alanyl-D-alanine dipeptidase
MTILLSDPRVSAVPVRDIDEPLVVLDPGFGSGQTLVRRELATRLESARAALPSVIHLCVVEGYRPAHRQQAIIERYSAEIRAVRLGIDESELQTLTSRYVAPLAVAPHVAGAAVDVTLVDSSERELDLGTPIDATPEQSRGRCYFAADGISREARANRDLLARVLCREGLVNYPTEWWHYSYGDRYWALATGAAAALYGPVFR